MTTENETTGKLNGVEKVRIRVLPDGRVTREDAARFIGIETKTLANWSLIGRGPRPRRVARRIFYLYDDLLEFVREQQAA